MNLPTIELAGNSSLIPAGWDRILGASFFKDLKLQIRRHLPVRLRESLHTSADQRVDQLLDLIVTAFSSTSIIIHTLGDPALKGEMKCATQIGDARNQRNTHEKSCHNIFSQLREKDQQNQRIQQKYTTPEMFLLPPAEQTKVPDQQKPEEKSPRIWINITRILLLLLPS